MKAQKSKWLYLKIGLYAILLYSVISIMQYVKSPTFSSNVDMVMGSPSQARVLTWCSNSVQVVFVVPGEQTIRDPKVIAELCHLAYSSYNSDEVANLQWSPFMKAMNEKGEEIVLEASPTHNFVKQGSLIYKMDGLTNKLTALGIKVD
tara:strand:- start:59577 stop:60020 length:444 start_codon:yes stop_codon:yes gene_type:complete